MELDLNSSLPFNLDFTLCCGQAFRWINLNDWWYGVIEGKVLKIKQKKLQINFS
jgi:N-glycosylase/DNA lyase